MSFGNGGGGGYDFGAAMQNGEAWSPPLQDILPKGNYVLRIAEATKGKSSGGFQQVELRLENEQGAIRDWAVFSPNDFAMNKFLGLVQSAGLPRATPGTDINAETGELSERYVRSLVGRQVGVVIRDEEDIRPDHAGEVRPRVQGYTTPEQIMKYGTSPPANPPAAQAQAGFAF